MNYFILTNDIQQGPFTIDELSRRGISQDTLVWCEGMAQWTPAWQVEELKPLLFHSTQNGPQPTATGPVPPPPPPPPFTRQSANTQQRQSPLNPEYPKRKSHKGLFIFLGIVVVILFILALTNPGPAEHRKAIADRLDSSSEVIDIADPTTRSIAQTVVDLGHGMMKRVLAELVDEDLEYHNYIFFSTTTLHSSLLRRDIRCSTGFLGHVSAISLSDILPDIVINQMTGSDDETESPRDNAVAAPDNDQNDNTQEKENANIDSVARIVTSRIAAKVTDEVKKQVKQQTDSATASGIEEIFNEIEKLIK